MNMKTKNIFISLENHVVDEENWINRYIIRNIDENG